MTDSIDKKPKEKWDNLDADLDAMLDEAESSLAPMDDDPRYDEDAIDKLFRDVDFDAAKPDQASAKKETLAPLDDEDAIDRLLMDAGLDMDEIDDIEEPEITQAVEAKEPELEPEQNTEGSAALDKEDLVAEEESLAPLDDLQGDDAAVDRLLMDTGIDADDASLINEADAFYNDVDINGPEITQPIEAGEPEQVAEGVLEQVDDNSDARGVDEADAPDEFDDFSDFSDFTEPEITQTDETDEVEQIVEDLAALSGEKEVQSIEDESEQAVEQPDALVVDETEGDFAEPDMIQQNEIEQAVPAAEDSDALAEAKPTAEEGAVASSPVNDLQNEEDAIDRLLMDTGFDANDVDLVVYDNHAVLLTDTGFDADNVLKDDADAFSGFGEIKDDDFAELNMILENDDKKTAPAVDSLELNEGSQEAGLIANAAGNRSDLMDDDKELTEIDDFTQLDLDEVGDVLDGQDKQEEPVQQTEPEQAAIQEEQSIQDDQNVREDDFLLPDFDITADTENSGKWVDGGIEEEKSAGTFDGPDLDLFSDDGALEDELEKIGQAPASKETVAEIKPAPPAAENNAAVVENAKNAETKQTDLEPEFLTGEQYRQQIIDAERRARRATIFSYIALGLCIVTLVAAGALAVMAFGAKTEILKLFDLVSALDQGTADDAIKSLVKEENKVPEAIEKQAIADKPVAEAAKAEAVPETEAEAKEPEVEAAKVEAMPEAEAVKPAEEAVKAEAEVEKPEVEAAKAEVKPVETVKPKAGAAKAGVVSETETAHPEEDTVKSAVVLKAAVDKAVAAAKAAEAKKAAAKKKSVKSAVKAPVPSVNWTVYLTAYKQEWYAKSKAAEFKQKGVPVEVVPGAINNSAWYRLRVRGFKNKGEAASYAARIKKALNLSSVSVSDN